MHENECSLFVKREVEVIARTGHQGAAQTWNSRERVRPGSFGRRPYCFQGRGEFFPQKLGCSRSMDLPPIMDDADLLKGVGGEFDSDGLHRPDLARSSVSTSSAGMPLPDKKSLCDRSRAACSRDRSSSSRSSLSSTGIKSTTVPSGRSTGSWSTRCPSFTVARSACVTSKGYHKKRHVKSTSVPATAKTIRSIVMVCFLWGPRG